MTLGILSENNKQTGFMKVTNQKYQKKEGKRAKKIEVKKAKGKRKDAHKSVRRSWLTVL